MTVRTSVPGRPTWRTPTTDAVETATTATDPAYLTGVLHHDRRREVLAAAASNPALPVDELVAFHAREIGAGNGEERSIAIPAAKARFAAMMFDEAVATLVDGLPMSAYLAAVRRPGLTPAMARPYLARSWTAAGRYGPSVTTFAAQAAATPHVATTWPAAELCNLLTGPLQVAAAARLVDRNPTLAADPTFAATVMRLATGDLSGASVTEQRRQDQLVWALIASADLTRSHLAQFRSRLPANAFHARTGELACRLASHPHADLAWWATTPARSKVSRIVIGRHLETFIAGDQLRCLLADWGTSWGGTVAEFIEAVQLVDVTVAQHAHGGDALAA